jgi:hypothetical protein
MYWLPDAKSNYSGLQHMPKAKVTVTATQVKQTSPLVEVVISNPAGGPVAFFQNLSVVSCETKKRTPPAYSAENYFSILPGQEKRIILDKIGFGGSAHVEKMICLEGWNNAKQYIEIKPTKK